MNFGFDIDGTITAAPEAYRVLMSSLRAAGHGVFVLTGTMDAEATPGHYQGRLQQLRLCGVAGYYDMLHIVTAPHALNKAKFCQEHQIAFMFEDARSYGEEIKKVATVVLMHP